MTLTKKPATDKPAKKPVARKPRAPKAVKPVAKEHVAPVVSNASVETVEVKPTIKPIHGKNFYAVGRRKTAVAQILLSTGNGTITINKLPLEGYFQTADLQFIAKQPLSMIGMDKHMNVKAKIFGGGIHAQAEALRHALGRAIILMDPETRRTVKKQGFLTRDPRVKERKKPGLKRARRAPQFSKR